MTNTPSNPDGVVAMLPAENLLRGARAAFERRIAVLSRTAVEGSPEVAEFQSHGDSILANEGDVHTINLFCDVAVKAIDFALSSPQVDRGVSTAEVEAYPRVDGLIAPPLEIGYTNYRGEFSVRCILPLAFWFGSTEWHPEPQWLVKAYDADKGAERDFAFKDFGRAPVAYHEPPLRDTQAGLSLSEIIEALIDARNQIEYLHGKFAVTSSGNAVMAQLDALRRKLQSSALLNQEAGK